MLLVLQCSYMKGQKLESSVNVDPVEITKCHKCAWNTRINNRDILACANVQLYRTVQTVKISGGQVTSHAVCSSSTMDSAITENELVILLCIS